MTLHLVSQVTGLVFGAGLRPLLTVCLLQVFAALAVRMNWVSIDPQWAALVSWPALAAGLALAAVELVLVHDGETDELRRDLHVDQITGALASSFGVVLLRAVHEPVPPELAGLEATLTNATAGGAGERPAWVTLAVLAAAVVANQVLTLLRRRIVHWLHHAGLDSLWAIAETGGVPLALLMAIFAPVLMLVVAAVLTLSAVALTLVARAAERRADERRRRACPCCGSRIRSEASLCPACRRPIEPALWI